MSTFSTSRPAHSSILIYSAITKVSLCCHVYDLKEQKILHREFVAIFMPYIYIKSYICTSVVQQLSPSNRKLNIDFTCLILCCFTFSKGVL